MPCGVNQCNTLRADKNDPRYDTSTAPTDADLTLHLRLLSWCASELPEIKNDVDSSAHEILVWDAPQRANSGYARQTKRRVRMAAIICAYLHLRMRLSVESEVHVLREKADLSAMDVQTICDLLATPPNSLFLGGALHWYKAFEFYECDACSTAGGRGDPPIGHTESHLRSKTPVITAIEVSDAFQKWFPLPGEKEPPTTGVKSSSNNDKSNSAFKKCVEFEDGESVLPLLQKIFGGVPEQGKPAGTSDAVDAWVGVKFQEVDVPFLRELYDVTARVYYHAAILHAASVFGGPHCCETNAGVGFTVDELRWRCRWSAPRQFYCLIAAGNAARIAALLLGSSWAEGFLSVTLRRQLYGAVGVEGSLLSRAWLCEDVELSGLHPIVASGIGLIATQPLQQGSLLLRESPLVCCSRTQLAVGDTAASGLEGINLLRSQLTEICCEAEKCLLRFSEVAQEDRNSLLGFLANNRSKKDLSQDQWRRISDYWRLLLRLPCLSYLHLQDRNPNDNAHSAPYSREYLVSELIALAQQQHEMTGIRDVDEFKIGLVAYPEIGFLGPREAGKGLYGFVRFINHNCCPNAMLYFPPALPNCTSSAGETAGGCPFSTEVCVVALRDITAGEEITVAYPHMRLFISQEERAKLSGVSCVRCQHCSERQILLEGVYCRDCGQLMLLGELHFLSKTPVSVKPNKLALHADTCVLQGDGAQLSLFKSAVVSRLNALQKDLAELEQRLLGEGDGVGKGDTEIDQPTLEVRYLLSLDENMGLLLPTTHYQRLLLRLTMLAVSTAAAQLSFHDSTRLLQICGAFLEDVEQLTNLNDPLRTGVRMQYVFLRARHVRAMLSTEQDTTEGCFMSSSIDSEGHGRGLEHVGCCGAIREEMAVLSRPYMRDGLVRECITMCFQEHYCQCMGWLVDRCLCDTCGSPEKLVLSSFLARYPVELEAAGCSTVRDLDMIACMTASTKEDPSDD